MAPDTAGFVATILNAAWWVRHYGRGSKQSIQRKQAIQKLGLTVRMAFDGSDDFEALLAALINGLSPKDDPPF